jgi:integrase/recombinase XerD
VTRLRKMMLEELQLRNYSAITTRNYLRVVADFAKYFGKSPDKLGPNELRTYQAYLLRPAITVCRRFVHNDAPRSNLGPRSS